MMVETRDNVVIRMRPRPNEDVNKYFMCDYGRMNYRWMNRQDRAETPLVRNGGVLATAEWEIAIRSAASLIGGKPVHVAASPMLSNETLFLLSELIEHNGGRGVFRVTTGEEAPLPGVEDLALRRDRAANVVGAEMLGYKRSASPLDGLAEGDVLIVADDDLADVRVDAASKASSVIVIGTTVPKNLESLAVVLPITNFAEEEGTFTNIRGRVQRFTQAKAAPGFVRPSWLVLGDLLGAMGAQDKFFLPSDVFANLASSKPQFAGLSYDTLGMRGLPVLETAGAA
jgi:NADH-quinone oxidoreductase subunit G